MGVITLALVAGGSVSSTAVYVPLWVKLSAAFAIALGTYLGGWRIIRTMGKGLVDISSPQGLAADASSATVILASSQLGFALSTTHVATGSIMGVGIGKKGATVRWSVAGRMVAAWAITFPAAAVIGAIMYWIAAGLGGIQGPLVVFLHPLSASPSTCGSARGTTSSTTATSPTTGTTAASRKSPSPPTTSSTPTTSWTSRSPPARPRTDRK
jgi:PiT family inorganic phosphate transporter